MPRDFELRRDILEVLEDLATAVEATASLEDEIYT